MPCGPSARRCFARGLASHGREERGVPRGSAYIFLLLRSRAGHSRRGRVVALGGPCVDRGGFFFPLSSSRDPAAARLRVITDDVRACALHAFPGRKWIIAARQVRSRLAGSGSIPPPRGPSPALQKLWVQYPNPELLVPPCDTWEKPGRGGERAGLRRCVHVRSAVGTRGVVHVCQLSSSAVGVSLAERRALANVSGPGALSRVRNISPKSGSGVCL